MTDHALALPQQQRLDTALAWPSRQVGRYVDAVRRAHPQATPAELIDVITRQYRAAATSCGGAFGTAAASRTAGPTAALALTAGSLAGFLSSSALYCLALAHVHGLPEGDLQQRRVLLQTALLGRSGPRLLEERFGLESPTWASVLLTRVPTAQVKSVSRVLRRRPARTALAGGTGLLLGRALPYGAGALLGAASARTMATRMIDSLAGAFGDPPQDFAAPPQQYAASAQDSSATAPQEFAVPAQDSAT